MVVIDVQEGDVHLQSHKGRCGTRLAELCEDSAHAGGHTQMPMGRLGINSTRSTRFGGLGAGPGLSRTGGSQDPSEGLGAVPLGGRGMDAMTPEIVPVTWDLFCLPLVLAEGDRQHAGGLGWGT